MSVVPAILQRLPVGIQTLPEIINGNYDEPALTTHYLRPQSV